MYTSVWAKYLPIIRIVLKRSLAAEQMLALNVQDFQKAGHPRKSGYKFLLKFREAKLDHIIVDLPLASSFATALLQDERIVALLKHHEFHFSLNPKFELSIKHIREVSPVTDDVTTAAAAV